MYPNSSDGQALSLANETTLSNRREHICHKFMAKMTNTRTVQANNPFNVRPSSSRPFNTFMRTKRSENFFTF